MKKLFVYLFLLAIIVLATGAGVVMTWTPKARAATDLKVDRSEAAVQRGRYLVQHVLDRKSVV